MKFGFTLIAVVFFSCFCEDGLVMGTALPYNSYQPTAGQTRPPTTKKPVEPTYGDSEAAKNLALCARTPCPLIYCANSLPAIPSQGICCPRCLPTVVTEPAKSQSSSSSSSEEKKDKDSNSKEKKNKSGSASSEKKDSKGSDSDSSEGKKGKGGSSSSSSSKEKKSKGSSSDSSEEKKGKGGSSSSNSKEKKSKGSSNEQQDGKKSACTNCGYKKY